MKFALLILLMSSSLWAEVLEDRIHSIEKIEDSGEYLIRFENGRVGFVDKVKNLERGQLLKGVLDKRSVLKNYKTLETNPLPMPLSLEPSAPAYEPTVLTVDQLNDFWNNLKVDYTRKSECSDRAFIWAYEGWKKYQYKTEMVFALFTASYINKHRFKWWFHVAPLVSVNTGEKVEKFVMDHQFLDRPVPIKGWTDVMVFSKRDCKLTKNFSEYDVNPQTEDCYMMIDSMYYRIPGHLSDQETKNIYRTEFNASELRMSYRLGFKTGANSL